jgi:hypothetical protein
MARPRPGGWILGFIRAGRIDPGIHPLTAPAWIAAIATVALAVVVILAFALARRALRAHAKQLADQREITRRLEEVVALQVNDLRLSLDERRRAQACRVFLELTRNEAAGSAPGAPDATEPPESGQLPTQVTATVHNNSQQPVYDLYVIWQLGTVRMGKPDRAPRLMPGGHVEFERQPEPPPSDAVAADPGVIAEPAVQHDPAVLSAFLTFRDAAGVRWTVREDGTLTDISPAHDARTSHD